MKALVGTFKQEKALIGAFFVIVKTSWTLVLSSNIYSVLRLATASLFTPGAGWCGPGWQIAEIVGSWAAANTIIITMARLIWAAYRTQRSNNLHTGGCKSPPGHPTPTQQLPPPQQQQQQHCCGDTGHLSYWTPAASVLPSQY